MTRNLALENQIAREAGLKRLRKANNYAKAIARGGFGQKAQEEYLLRYPEAAEYGVAFGRRIDNLDDN